LTHTVLMDEERHGDPFTMSTDMGPATLGSGCSESAGTSDERHQERDLDVDAAGHRSGTHHCDPSTLETWTRTAPQHRTGLIGNGRAITGSSGREPAEARRSNIRQQLERIMDIPDEESMLRSMRRYLTEVDNLDSSVPGTTQPPVRHTISDKKTNDNGLN